MKLMNYAGITMLAAAPLIFAACSSDTEVTNDFADVTGETVKSQFSIALPSNKIKNGRMAAGEAQEGGVFLGMEDIRLFPLSTDSASITDATKLDLPLIQLDPITSAESGGNTAQFIKVYSDVLIPYGTRSFLFYGHSTPATGNKGKTGLIPYWQDNGVDTNTPVNTLSFTPETCYKGETGTQQATILTALNGVATVLKAASDSEGGTGDMTDLYNAYITNRAGSSTSVLAMMEDLYNSIKIKGDAAADYVKAVATEIEVHFDPTTVGDNNHTLAWKGGDLNYPNVNGIPDGGVSVTCTNGTFAYTNNVSMDGVEQTQLDRFVKPASLYYFAKTAAGVDDQTNFGIGGTYENAAWGVVTGVGTLYSFDTPVGSTTKSVILRAPIQYGVAQLKTTVKVATKPILDSKDKVIVTPGEGYKVTGILVGDQKAVDWKFNTTIAADATAYTVYDGEMTDNAMTAKLNTESEANYTTLLETKGGSEETVKVAIELENTSGTDFYGVSGQLIPAGTKFYLVGSLKVSQGTGSTIDKVFKQDYQTVAKFTINSLKNAYNVVPDLRSPKLEFALSVNLEWQKGLTFEVGLE